MYSSTFSIEWGRLKSLTGICVSIVQSFVSACSNDLGVLSECSHVLSVYLSPYLQCSTGSLKIFFEGNFLRSCVNFPQPHTVETSVTLHGCTTLRFVHETCAARAWQPTISPACNPPRPTLHHVYTVSNRALLACSHASLCQFQGEQGDRAFRSHHCSRCFHQRRGMAALSCNEGRHSALLALQRCFSEHQQRMCATPLSAS